jgi:hypothetical protein
MPGAKDPRLPCGPASQPVDALLSVTVDCFAAAAAVFFAAPSSASLGHEASCG